MGQDTVQPVTAAAADLNASRSMADIKEEIALIRERIAARVDETGDRLLALFDPDQSAEARAAVNAIAAPVSRARQAVLWGRHNPRALVAALICAAAIWRLVARRHEPRVS